jgi:hypothetical protein
VTIKGLPKDKLRNVVIKPSTIPGAGLGLFAARDLATLADRISKKREHEFKIAPYLGDVYGHADRGLIANLEGDYIITVGSITVDSNSPDSCYPRYSNDAVCLHKDNARVFVIDGVLWLVPLPNVDILEGQEIVISYDWHWWYSRWWRWSAALRQQILERYPVADSLSSSDSDVTRDLTSSFWYLHWEWWPTEVRREIQRKFPKPSTNTPLDPFPITADEEPSPDQDLHDLELESETSDPSPDDQDQDTDDPVTTLVD